MAPLYTAAVAPFYSAVDTLQGGLLLFERKYDAAIAAAEKAVALNPNHATNTALLALILNQAGDPARAVSVIKTAMRLSPYYPSWFVQTLGFAHLGTGKYAAALAAFDEYVERARSPHQRAEGLLARAEGLAGLEREAEARAEIARALELAPEIVASHNR